MQISSLKTPVIINKIKRISLVIFLKRYVILFTLIAILAISLLIGFWNIRDIKFVTKEDSNIQTEVLHASLTTILGKNIFTVSPEEIKDLLEEGSGYVKGIYVNKKIPSTIEIQIIEYIPRYVGYSSNKCLLFSSEGHQIQEICEECLDTCLEVATDPIYIYVQSNSSLVNSKRLIFYTELSSIEKILKSFGHQLLYIQINEGIATITSIEDKVFIFDITEDLDIQLSRMYLIGQKINKESIEFKSLDLRFERPVMKLK